MSNYRVAFISLGCAKNLVNTEQMAALVREAGHTIVPDPEGADVCVLNTCGFIDSAKSEAIDHILELARLKDAGQLKKILVAGCLSQQTHNALSTHFQHTVMRWKCVAPLLYVHIVLQSPCLFVRLILIICRVNQN